MRLCHFRVLLFACCFVGAAYPQQPASVPETNSITLPTSKQILGAVPGNAKRLNSFPGSIALSPDGQYAAILNTGRGTVESSFRQSIAILDLRTKVVTDFPDERLGPRAHQTYFLGLAFSSRGDEVYASVGSISDATGAKSGNTGNGVAVYSFANGLLVPARFLKLPLQELAAGRRNTHIASNLPNGKAVSFPAGLAVVPAHSAANGGDTDQLLVANNYADNVVLLDARSGATVHTFDLSRKGDVPRLFPYGVLYSPGSTTAYVSLWNSATVVELDLAKGKVRRRITLEPEKRRASFSAHASAMALSPNGEWLFVALANRDRVAAVRTASGKVVRMFATEVPGLPAGGATPVAVAVNRDGSRLYVADAGLDAVAVYQLDRGAPGSGGALGFIPTEWYPTAIAVQGDDLLAVSGKATGSGPNGTTVVAKSSPKPFPYILSIMHGSVAQIGLREAEQRLGEFTSEVRRSNLMDRTMPTIEFHPEVMGSLPSGSRGPIKHVIYVIKENRTYDQVLGDLGVGDGDKSLTMFGWDVTPNHHRLALQFGVLDNFYDSGEVSGDGHVWSTAAITSDYHERVLGPSYRGERTYDYEGKVGNEYPLQQKMPDVAEPSTGYLWANAARHHRTYRHYGEYVDTQWCTATDWKASPASTGLTTSGTNSKVCGRKAVLKGETLPSNVGEPRGGPSPWPWPVPMIAGNVPTKRELVGHFDPLYADFKSEYPDQLRADEFLNEFARFVDARNRGDKKRELPELVVLRLPNDHTLGTRAKLPTPAAAVADNDLALGRVVDAVSHSAYWDDTAILVLEDDAQDGPDHVDAHRSLALVISKYAPISQDAGGAKRPFLEHGFYTTVNMIRTLEDLLGLPPMNQNDALAAPMSRMFSGKGEQPAFTADTRNRDNGLIYAVNPEKGVGAKESAQMDFSKADAADTAKLNRVLWRNRMGSKPMPEVKHTVFPE